MIDYRSRYTFNAVGQYSLGNVAEMGRATMVIQTRLLSGTGVTWGLRLRGTGGGVSDAANAPRAGFIDMLANNAAVAPATAITAASTIALSKIDCEGCDVILDILSVTSGGTLELFAWPITHGV